VAGEQRRHEQEAPARRRLRADVAGRVEDARRGAERGRGPHHSGGGGDARRRREPEDDGERGPVRPVRRAAERDGEEDEAGERDRDARALGPRQPLRDEQREDADPAG
jgi:hypothetical protein